jgi:hypothetical protein
MAASQTQCWFGVPAVILRLRCHWKMAPGYGNSYLIGELLLCPNPVDVLHHCRCTFEYQYNVYISHGAGGSTRLKGRLQVIFCQLWALINAGTQNLAYLVTYRYHMLGESGTLGISAQGLAREPESGLARFSRQIDPTSPGQARGTNHGARATIGSLIFPSNLTALIF